MNSGLWRSGRTGLFVLSVVACMGSSAAGGGGDRTGCTECPCQGGITSLTLRYNGTDGATVTVEDRDGEIFGATS